MTKKSTLFSGGKVIDGKGSPSIDADVFITEDKIVSVGSDARKKASQRWRAPIFLVCINADLRNHRVFERSEILVGI